MMKKKIKNIVSKTDNFFYKFFGSDKSVKSLQNIHEAEKIFLCLNKNGKEVQLGNSSEMIFKFEKIISHVSKFYSLKIGDLIYTGTPEGVGKVDKGDVLNGFIGEQEMFKVVIK